MCLVHRETVLGASHRKALSQLVKLTQRALVHSLNYVCQQKSMLFKKKPVENKIVGSSSKYDIGVFALDFIYLVLLLLYISEGNIVDSTPLYLFSAVITSYFAFTLLIT